MKHKKLFSKAVSLFLCASLILSPFGAYGLSTPKVAQAFSAGETIDENFSLTEKEIKDTNLLTLFKVIVNYEKARKNNSSLGELTGNEDLLSDSYAKYRTGDITFGELKSYTGVINLSKYAGRINNIEGLGYARGASRFDLGKCTSITAIPANEFGKCSMEEIILPSTVTVLGTGAFQQATKLKRVLINGKTYSDSDAIADLSNVTSIGDYAFDGCQALSIVNLNSSENLYLGKSAFSNCSLISEITLPMKNANNLGDSAFTGCKNLETITFADELSYIPSNCFNGASIDTIKIIGKEYTGHNVMPSGLTYVGNSAFQDVAISGMSFENSKKLTVFGDYSFAGAVIYDEFIMPSSLEKINTFAFNSAAFIDTDTFTLFPIVIPDSVTQIEKKAFHSSAISDITISSGVETIEEETFNNCSQLENITIKAKADGSYNLKAINTKAFYKCTSLNNTDFIKDVNSLTTIGDSAFAECSYYEANKINGKNIQDIYGSWIYFGLTDVTLPNSVTKLGSNAFANCYSLETVNLGSGITEISANTFNMKNVGLSSLKKVILPKNLLKIQTGAFVNNPYLRTIGYTDGTKVTVTPGTAMFGDSLIYIGENAFKNCSATKSLSNAHFSSANLKGQYVKIVDKLVHDTYKSGDETFLIYKDCSTEFEVAYINPADLQNAMETTLEADDPDFLNQIEIYVIAQKIWAKNNTYDVHNEIENILYDDAFDSSLMSEILVFDYTNSGYNNIPVNISFLNCDEANISTTQTADSASFYRLYSGTTQRNGSGTTMYPTFSVGLKNIILPDSLTDTDSVLSLGKGVFSNCIALDEVTLSKNMTTIPENAFYSCASQTMNWVTNKKIDYTYQGINYVNNFENIVDIQKNAFYNCYSLKLKEGLTGGEISDVLENVGSYAFYNCKSITSIVFHSKLKSIGSYAFSNCSETYTTSYSTVNSSGQSTTSQCTAVRRPLSAKGLGLASVDFTYANKIESIGNNAFSLTCLEVVNLPDAKYTLLPANTFDGCTLLNTVTVPDNVTEIGAKAFSNCASLKKLHMPATAIIDPTILYGNTPGSIPGLQMINSDKNTDIVIPTSQTFKLPINSLSTQTRTMGYTVTVFEGVNDTKGTVIYDNNGPVSNTAYENIISANITYNDKKPDEVFLTAGSTNKNNMIVKVQASSSFKQSSNTSVAIINAQTFTFNVKIAPVPASSVSVQSLTKNVAITTATDASGKEVEAIYVPKNIGSFNLKATLNPSNTSDTCSWTIDDSSVANISDVQNSQAAGTVKVNVSKLGNTKIVLRCGNLTKEIYLYVKVPFKSFTASTGLTTETNSSDAFEMTVGTKEKITVKTSYDSSYTSEEYETYKDTISFESSDTSIARVDAGGEITALAEGECTITLKSLASGYAITYKVTVVTDVINQLIGKSIASIDGAKDIYTGQSIQLKATLNPSKAINGINWYVTSGIAVISKEGVLTAGAKPGKVTIKAVMLDAGGNETKQTKSVTINVLQAAASVVITDRVKNLTLNVGNTATISKTTSSTKLGYSLSPATSTDSVTVVSSNPAVATAVMSRDSIIVKGISTGSANITITATSGATITFPVKIVQPITSITLPKTITLYKGTAKQLTPTFLPATSNDTLKWTSRNTSVVTVSDTGIITAVGKGTTSVTVSASSGKSATISVTVKIAATKLVAQTDTNVKTVYMAKGTTKTIACARYPFDSDDVVTFKSSKPSVVAISVYGLSCKLTAKKTGTSKITMTSGSGKKATVTVKVVKKASKAKKVKISGKKTVKVKKTLQLTAKLTKKSSTDTVTWSSSNSGVAKVDAYGLVTGIKKGKATITCTAASGKKSSIKITVKK